MATSWGSTRGRRQVVVRMATVGQTNAAHPAAAAHGANRDVDAGEIFEQVLPVRRDVALIAGAVVGWIVGL